MGFRACFTSPEGDGFQGLRVCFTNPYKNKLYLQTLSLQRLRKNIMDKFEEIGQKLDAELTRLR